MCPSASADRPDTPGLFHELIPGLAAVGDDVVVTLEDAVREPVVAQELPDVLDRVELGRAGRQRQKGDVVRHDQPAGDVPAGLIEQEDGMGARGRRWR